MGNSYWNRIAERRQSRRSVLAVTGGLAGALALSISCGDSDSDKGKVQSSLTIPEDTSSKAKTGGVLKSFAMADPTSFDVLGNANSSTFGQVGQYAYQRLWKFVPAKYPELPSGDVEGDFLESYEQSADGLQITAKIRQGMKWDSRAPTSGRAPDAEDLIYTWNKFRAVGAFKGSIVYDANTAPLAPVESMVALDNRTVQIKLKRPDPDVFVAFAHLTNSFFVMPRESESGFNPRSDIRGSGPWILDEYRPSAGRRWKKNPDYYVKGRPFIDGIEMPLLSDYSARLSQFRAGNVWTTVATQDDVIQTKKDVPATIVQKQAVYQSNTYALGFGYQERSPYRDERVRQAVSQALDREASIDVFANRQQFEAEGLPVETALWTAISANWEGYWLDPMSKDFGPNAKYYKYDAGETKKLLAAAGFANGFDTKLHFNTTNYPAAHVRGAEVAAGMLRDIGIRAAVEPQTYPEPYLSSYLYAYSQNQHPGKVPPGRDGLTMVVFSTAPTVSLALFQAQHKDGTTYKGMSPNGQNAHLGDADINRRIEAIMGETNKERKVALVHEYQRVFAQRAYLVPWIGFGARSFVVSWPVIGNYGLYETPTGSGAAAAEYEINYWIDSTKAPLA